MPAPLYSIRLNNYRERVIIGIEVRNVSYRFTAVIQQEGSWFVARCAENNVASQGQTLESALDNLKEALSLYYEDNDMPLPDIPTFITTFEVAM